MKQCEIDRLIESKTSRTKQKGLIFGVGHFDVSFPRSIRINGRQHNHSAYSVWNSMLRRCYAQHKVKMARNYAGCSVCDEWLYFSNFLTFYKAWHRENYALDKDLLMLGTLFRDVTKQNLSFMSTRIWVCLTQLKILLTFGYRPAMSDLC